MIKQSSRCVHKLSIHLIFVIKYRKKLLQGAFGEDVKRYLTDSSNQSDKFEIQTLEIDKDHVHMMVDFLPTETISNIVKRLKSYSTHHAWLDHEWQLTRQFWKKKMLWTPSYFVCSIGDASKETIQKYIENQGGREFVKRS
jgi:putative transposase